MPSKGAKTPSRGPVRGTSDLRRADANGVAPPEQPDKVRNVALVGHSGSGKTMLTEALLAATGAITRKGSIAEGTTVSDSDPSAIAQQRSVALAVVPVMVGDIKVNLLDTPGYTDFIGELRAGLRAADAVLFVVSATDDVDAATTALWSECQRLGMPRAVVISRLDHPRADFDAAIARCRLAFGDSILPLYLPVRRGRSRHRAAGTADRHGFRLQCRGTGARHPGRDRRRTRRRGVRAGRADRRDHCRERRRDAHGPLPRRRGNRPRRPDHRSGDGRGPRVLPSGAADVGGVRARPGGTARGPGACVSDAGGARRPRGDRPRRGARRRARLRPRRSAAR